MTDTPIFDPATLKRGDWINMQFGFNRHDFYILNVSDSLIYLGKPDWLVSGHQILTHAELTGGFYEPIHLGSGKEKWYWRFLPWRDLICPFNKPHHHI